MSDIELIQQEQLDTQWVRLLERDMTFRERAIALARYAEAPMWVAAMDAMRRAQPQVETPTQAQLDRIEARLIAVTELLADLAVQVETLDLALRPEPDRETGP